MTESSSEAKPVAPIEKKEPVKEGKKYDGGPIPKSSSSK